MSLNRARSHCRWLSLPTHDRDTKFCHSFRSLVRQSGVKPMMLPANSPNLNAFAERWVRSVRQECLSKLVLCSERSLMRVLTEFTAHYYAERNHQGKGILILFPERLGDMAKSNVTSVWEACLSTTLGPHEYFGHTADFHLTEPGLTFYNATTPFCTSAPPVYATNVS